MALAAWPLISSSTATSRLVLGATVAAGGVVVASLCGAFVRLRRAVFEATARLQIIEFAGRYTRGLDRLDAALIRSAFTGDGVLSIPNVPEDLKAADFSVGATQFLGKTLVASMHAISNPHVVFDARGTRAKSEMYFVANHFKKDGAEIRNAAVYGRYCDSWVMCPDGNFRVAHRKLLYDFQGDLWNKTIQEMKDDDTLKQKPAAARPDNLGTRDKSDFIYKHILAPFDD